MQKDLNQAQRLGLTGTPSFFVNGHFLSGAVKSVIVCALIQRCGSPGLALADRIAEHFDGLPLIMRASVADLEEVEGVGEARARSVKEGLARLAEASILDRYS